MDTCERGSKKAGKPVVYFGEESWQALWSWVGVWGEKAVDCANLGHEKHIGMKIVTFVQ